MSAVWYCDQCTKEVLKGAVGQTQFPDGYFTWSFRFRALLYIFCSAKCLKRFWRENVAYLLVDPK